MTHGTPYQYQVRAAEQANGSMSTLYSDWTAAATATTPLAAPTNLWTSQASPEEVDIAWTNNSNSATGFEIDRSTNNVDWTPIATPSVSQNFYQDTTIVPGTQYYYRVEATGPSVNSASSPSAMVSTTPVAPNAPTNLSASTVDNPTVTLTWSADPRAAGYNIYRSDNGGMNWNSVGSTSGNSAVTFNDSSTVEQASYEYAVTGVNAGGESAQSQSVTVTTFLAAPTGLSAAASTNQVALSWTNHSNIATGYEVQRGANGQWTTIYSSSDPTTTSFTDSNLSDDTSYSYEAWPLGPSGNSDFTLPASANIPLASPSGLTATTLGSNSIELDWTNDSSAATGINILRSTNGGNAYTLIDSIGAGTTTYIDQSLATGQTASYELIATTGNTSSSICGPVTATALPAVPTNLQAQSLSSSSVELTWQDGSNGAAGYQIYRSDDGTDYNLIYTAAAGDRSYVDTNLSENSVYQYMIDAVNAAGRPATRKAFLPQRMRRRPRDFPSRPSPQTRSPSPGLTTPQIPPATAS